jgi:glyoxylase-like metal-dependent hydrolase (beta-lactamase superfamily II)
MTRPGYARFDRIPTSQDWFDVYRVSENLFVFHEARHWEESVVSLLVGRDEALLVDTGCGIGNLREAVEEVTDRPVTVVNTHTHLDHIGGNRLFDKIFVFDHPVSRRVAASGASREALEAEILAEGLITGPWPRGFEVEAFELPPFEVDRWLADGDRIDIGGAELEVIHTPGESPDHLSLLDRTNRLLFCGDILLHGAVWTHLEGGSLEDLVASYRRLMGAFEAFDHLMPGHNEPWIDRSLLPEALAAAEIVAAGDARPEPYIDPWNRRLRRYPFDRFEILTR